mmetsp:Transcript_17839/g.19343  ORF Transcript_17839/g.19343 Transcript_17839/m.19343 type:complete len:272 (-) Transcript_17839:144-959(-)
MKVQLYYRVTSIIAGVVAIFMISANYQDASALIIVPSLFVNKGQRLAVVKQKGSKHRPNTNTIKTTTPRMNAAVLPTVYRILAAGSAVRVVTTGVGANDVGTVTSAAVLLTTAAAASFDLAPSAAGQLASAKRAYQAGLPNATAWRTAVRIKIVGQIVGLLFSLAGAGGTELGALVGATCIVGADTVFWALGGGSNRFECDGVDGVRSAPIAKSLVKALLGVNMVMLLSVLVGAAWGRSGSLLRKGGAAVFCTGILAQIVGNEKTRRRRKK